MRYTFLVFALTSFFLLSCHKEKMTGLTLERYRNILDSTTLVCNGISNPYYISANINGVPVCYSNGVDGFSLHAKPLSFFTTNGTSTLVGGDSIPGNNVGVAFQLEAFRDFENYTNSFLIWSPKWSGSHVFKNILDRYLITGKHPILGSNMPDSAGYNIALNIYYDHKDKYPGVFSVHSLDISSQNGLQDRNSYIEFTKVDKKYANGTIIYDIEIEFKCKIYHSKSSPENGKLYGDITDGKMVMQIVIPE